MLTDELLIELEKAHLGRLTAEEKRRLEEKISNNTEVNAEAATYQKIWEGFDALKGEEQSKKFQQWEQDWRDIDEEELIEWYVNNELGDHATLSLDEKYNTDKIFAQKVDAYRSINEGLSSLKSESFRSKMASWEPKKEEAKPRTLSTSWRRPLAIAASVLLVISTGFAWWNMQRYSNDALVEKHTSLAITGTTMGNDATTATYLSLFDQAHKNLKNKDYEQAFSLFSQLEKEPFPLGWSADVRKYYFENRDWNYILSALGAGKTEGDFMKRLNKIATNENHSYTDKAKALEADLNTFWRF